MKHKKGLPAGITEDMLKPNVEYIYEKRKRGWREYFRVHNWDLLRKPFGSSRRKNVSALEKLKQANEFAENLLAGNIPEIYRFN